MLGPAIVLRGCVFDFYAIHSSSMMPAFEGHEEAGDHLLVLRRAVDTRTLQRWDVVVMEGAVDNELPGDMEALLKRVVALPGEKVRIMNGDVHIVPPEGGEPRIARKPDDVIERLLVPIHESDGLVAPWTWVGPGEREDLPGGGTRLVADVRKGVAVFDRSLHDDLVGHEGEVRVRDTALEVVVGEGDGTLERMSGGDGMPIPVHLAGWSWGGQFADLDHNGFLDLYVANGYYTAPSESATEVDL